jgi:hypothetical protein
MKNPRLYRRKKLALVLYLKDVYARRQLQADQDFWRCLSPIFSNSMSTGCDFYELWMLYKYVLKAKPKCILELGSGVSTVVIAYAIKKENYSCKFVSMEESAPYYENLKAMIPKDLAPLVDLRLSPAEDRPLDNGLVARCYVDKPRHAYDFVFIDGPQYPKAENYFDGDLLDAIAWNDQPFVAFLDERLTTRRNLKKILPFVRCRETKGFTKFFVPAVAKRKITYAYRSQQEPAPRQEAAG